MSLMTSCLDDDDDDEDGTITEEQLYAVYQEIRGTYTGTISYYELESDNTLSSDTVTQDIQWTISSESTLTIKDFPSELLAQYITSETIAAAVAEQEPQDLTCNWSVYSISPIQLLVNPYTLSYTVTYEGVTYEVQIPFYVNSYYSFATYDSDDKEMTMQIVAGALYVDGVQNSNFVSSGAPFVLAGELN